MVLQRNETTTLIFQTGINRQLQGNALHNDQIHHGRDVDSSLFFGEGGGTTLDYNSSSNRLNNFVAFGNRVSEANHRMGRDFNLARKGKNIFRQCWHPFLIITNVSLKLFVHCIYCRNTDVSQQPIYVCARDMTY